MRSGATMRSARFRLRRPASASSSEPRELPADGAHVVRGRLSAALVKFETFEVVDNQVFQPSG
jgi:hypothetical protein